MKSVKAQLASKENEYFLSEAELEKARQRVTFYDVILDDAEAEEFDEITKRHYEGTTQYEQNHRSILW